MYTRVRRPEINHNTFDQGLGYPYFENNSNVSDFQVKKVSLYGQLLESLLNRFF